MNIKTFFYNNKKGVTIVETIVGCVLFAFSVVAILSFSVQNITLSKAGDYYYVANNLAKNRIERIRKIRDEKGIDYLPYLAESDTVIDRSGNPDINGNYVRTTEINTNYGNNLVLANVSVNYRMKGELRPNPVTLTTVFNEYQGVFEE